MEGSATLLALGSVVSLMALVVGWVYVSQPTVIQERLDKFGGRPQQTLEELELRQPFAERVLRPLLRSLSRVILSRTPQSTLEQIRHDLLVGGSPGGLDVRDFLGLKGMGAMLLGGASFLFVGRNMDPVQAVLVAGGACFIGFYIPNFWLGSRIKTRKNEIQKALPDALDLLCICVEAGLGFDSALNKVTDKWKNALAQEFGRVLAEIRMGKSRREALRDLATRTDVADVATFITAVVQADQLGVSIGNVLLTQAVNMRTKRRQRAEELAQQAGIKMIFPMVLLIFPALWVVILGPALPSLVSGLASAR